MLPSIVDFTPFHSLIGGALLGAATLCRMALTGRILGVSGIAGGLVRGKPHEVSRWLFTAGLVFGGLGLREVYPSAYGSVDVAPWRLLVGGFAVGLGAGLGNGCTSGHGISGNARFSPRSMLYTVTFMASGFAVASLLASASHVRVQAPAPLPSVEVVLQLATRLFSGHAAAYVAVAALSLMGTLPASLAVAGVSFVDGSLFAFGLGLSGMTSPARVAQFLDVSAGAWNPSLALVMVGALAVFTPFMQALVLRKRLAKPVLGGLFDTPTSSVIDRKLVAGGVVFGAGWGLAGMCPGPALVSVASPFGAPVFWLAAMFAGLALSDSSQIAALLRSSPAPAAKP